MNSFERLSNTPHPKPAKAIAIACSFLLLVLPSCGIPNLRPPDPAAPLPGEYDVRKAETKSDLPEVFPEDTAEAPSSESSAQLKFQEFFDDPSLLTLINQALARNQEQKILIQDVQIAFNQILLRQGAYLPFVTLGSNAGLDKASKYTLEGAGIRDDSYSGGGFRGNNPNAPARFFTNPHGNFQLGANLYWQLDIWKQLRNARDAAISRYLATNEGRNFAVTRLVAEIANNYYELLALDKRIEILDQTIALQEQSRKAAVRKKEAALGTELAVQRFQAEVSRNQSEKLIVDQQIIEVENRINFLVGRFPQPVERTSGNFVDLTLHKLSLGLPPQLLQNRPDIRQAERELVAAGLDVKVARTLFYPRLIINGGVGYSAFNAKYLLLTPEALIYNLAGELVAPLVNKRAIQSEFLTANARQLQAVYNLQRVVLNAFTEVINRMSRAENYGKSIEIKKKQVAALELSVELATQLFQAARVDYMDVLFAQRDLRDARTVLIETKQQQLSAIINTYQALGGGNALPNILPDAPQRNPWWKHFTHSGTSDEK